MLGLDYRYTTEQTPLKEKRTPDRLDWMFLHSIGLSNLYSRLNTINKGSVFEAQHTAQVLSFEHYINNSLNLTKDVTITDGYYLPINYVYKRNEVFSKPTYIFRRGETGAIKKYFGQRDEILEGSYDFVVTVDSNDKGLEAQIKALIEKLKPVDKTYIIEYI